MALTDKELQELLTVFLQKRTGDNCKHQLKAGF